MIKDVCHIHVFVMERGHVLFVRYGGLHMYNEEGKQNESRPVVSRLWAFSRALQGVFTSCILQKSQSVCNQTTAMPE